MKEPCLPFTTSRFSVQFHSENNCDGLFWKVSLIFIKHGDPDLSLLPPPLFKGRCLQGIQSINSIHCPIFLFPLTHRLETFYIQLHESETCTESETGLPSMWATPGPPVLVPEQTSTINHTVWSPADPRQGSRTPLPALQAATIHRTGLPFGMESTCQV